VKLTVLRVFLLWCGRICFLDSLLKSSILAVCMLGVLAYYFNFLFYFVDILLLLLYSLSLFKFLMLCGITIVHTMIQTAGLTEAICVQIKFTFRLFAKFNSYTQYSAVK